MNTAKKWIAYLVYTVAVALLFLYVLFPDEAVRRYIEFRANRAASEIEVGIERLSLNFPPALAFGGVGIKYAGTPPLRIDEAMIRPAYLSLLGSSPAFHIDSALAGGTIAGDTRISGTSGKQPDIRAQFSVDNVDIGAIALIKEVTRHHLTGKLGGSIEYSGGTKTFGTGSAQLTLSDGAIEFASPIFGIESLDLRRISAAFDMQNRRLTLKELNLEGDQMSGKGSGSMILSVPLQNSRINLTGTVTPHPSLLRSIGGVLPKRYLRDGRVPIRISGTLGRPRFSMQ